MSRRHALVVGMGPSTGEDYGLDAIAQHNAIPTTESFSSYNDDVKGLGIYNNYVPVYGQSSIQNPPTPRSNSRSVRSAGRHDSPFSTGKSRVSKSPAVRVKKEKKMKADKIKTTPRLTAPLSVLTKDMSTPLKDMDAWVNRSADVRRKETERRNGYVTRPMNSFMLYRSAYAERTKAWCTQNNHQVVSSVSGESWPMEPQEVRDQFNDWAKLERANHQAAHPDYKFSPSKPVNKRRKDDMSDVEDDGSSDGEYRAGRSIRQRRQAIKVEPVYLEQTVGFSSNPYYGQQSTGYHQSQYQYTNPSRPVPSNVAYDRSGMPYNPQNGQYIQSNMQHQGQYQYTQGVDRRVSVASSVGTPRTIGNYGLPSQQQAPVDELFSSPRADTPMQASYGQFSPSGYGQYQQYQQQQAYGQQYPPQSATRTALASVDPALEAEFIRGLHTPATQSEGQFESAMGDMTSGEYVSMNFFDDNTSPSTVLAPVWKTE